MSGRHAHRTFIGAMFLAAAISCGGEGSPITGSVSDPGVRILTPRTVEDTISAFLASSLTLEVRDSSGAPAAARKVTISSHLDVPDPFGFPVVGFSLSPGVAGVLVLNEVTDARGQLAVVGRLGDRVSSGWITVDAGTLGRDSIHAVVRPGAPARLVMQPRDTAIAVGVSYTPTAVVRDRTGNLLGSTPVLASRRAPVASVNGGSIRAESPGRVFVVGTIGTGIDSVAASVVPSGTLAAFGGTTLASFDLDGTNYQSTSLTVNGFNNYSPRWLPQRNLLVFHGHIASFGYSAGLFTLDASNQPTVLYSPGLERDGAFPQPSRDGAWIYYTQRVGWQSNEIWRMRLDGTGRERVGPTAGYYDSYSQATPSPDGRVIAYTQNDGGAGSGVVRLNRLDLMTGVSSSLGAFGTHPRWSPVANEIAYLAGHTVRIVQGDGTGDRVLATGVMFDYWGGQLDWSPDGKWLVACERYEHSGGRRLTLISRATGELLPLPFSYRQNLCEATWKR